MIHPDNRIRIECECGHASVVILEGGILRDEIKRRGRCCACGQRRIKGVTLMSTHREPELGGYVVGKDGIRRRYETRDEMERLARQP